MNKTELNEVKKVAFHALILTLFGNIFETIDRYTTGLYDQKFDRSLKNYRSDRIVCPPYYIYKGGAIYSDV